MVMGVLRHVKYFKGWHRPTPSVHQHPPDQRQTKIGRNSRRTVWVRVFRCGFCQWTLKWNVSWHLVQDGIHYRMPNNKNIFDERENWKSPVAQTATCNIVYLSRADIAGAIRFTFSFFFFLFFFRQPYHISTTSFFVVVVAGFILLFIVVIYRNVGFLSVVIHYTYHSWRYSRTYEPKLSGVSRHVRIHVMLGIVTKRMNDDDDDKAPPSTNNLRIEFYKINFASSARTHRRIKMPQEQKYTRKI